jgi:antitoxin (DNA-binding transcriptional repressor) of toxin-antitoxin stability system
MDKDNTISLQEVRKDPLGFLKQVNKGKRMTVIYHSKPFATVMSADTKVTSQPKSTKQLLQYAKLARNSAKLTLDNTKIYKELYYEDKAKKYGIS